jgi:hypothetical protein
MPTAPQNAALPERKDHSMFNAFSTVSRVALVAGLLAVAPLALAQAQSQSGGTAPAPTATKPVEAPKAGSAAPTGGSVAQAKPAAADACGKFKKDSKEHTDCVAKAKAQPGKVETKTETKKTN